MKPVENGYAYDPRLVEIEGTFYITWCDDFPGASIGMGRTNDFQIFIKMENPTMPFNRNGVLFPRKVKGEYLLLKRPSDRGRRRSADRCPPYSITSAFLLKMYLWEGLETSLTSFGGT